MSLKYHISHCLFLQPYNIFILGLNANQLDKKGRKLKLSPQLNHSMFQVFSFKQLSQVKDSYLLKSGEPVTPASTKASSSTTQGEDADL